MRKGWVRVMALSGIGFICLATPAINAAEQCSPVEWAQKADRVGGKYDNSVIGHGEAVHLAEWWQRAGDIAFVNQEPEVAFLFYYKLAKTFPKTPHGRIAVHRGRSALRKICRVNSYPPEEDFLGEIYDFLTW